MTSTKKALLVVDVQKDFTEGGTLGCQGGKEVAQSIKPLVQDPTYHLVISSQDWHTAGEDNGGHFAAIDSSPNFTTTWPEHCVAGTPGASYEEPLQEEDFTHHIKKGQSKPAYSAFEGVEATTGEELTDLLWYAGVTDLDVVGIAFDYCVKATALDAVAAGFTVRVLEDLTASVAEESHAAAREELLKAGVEVTHHSLKREN